LEPWSKLFQNLRATRATELADEFPPHVAADWLGHSTMIADKHYRQTTADHFARALHPALQSPAATDGSDGNEGRSECEKPLNVQKNRVLPIEEVGDTRLAHQSKPSGNHALSSIGAVKSAADSELNLVVDAWPQLTAHSRAIILGMARKAKENFQRD
jgi:hypothetical protein